MNVLNQTKRSLSIDILKVIMSFIIVGVHGFFLKDISNYVGYMFVYSIGRLAIPCFLLVSGYYLYNVKTAVQFKKWIKHLFVLYVIWFFIYFYFLIEEKESLRRIIIFFFFGHYQLWYIILSLYALVIFWFLRNLKSKWLLFLCIGLALAGLFLEYGANYLSLNDSPILIKKIFDLKFIRNILFFYLPYIGFGFLINKHSLSKSQAVNRPMSIMFLLIAFALLFVEANMNFEWGRKHYNIALMAYFVAPLLFMKIIEMPYYISTKTVAYYSIGIYLVHYIFILLKPQINEYLQLGNSLYVVFVFLISALVTSVLILINKRVKYLL